MKINWTLNPNESRKIQVDGKYLIVTKTAGRLEVAAGGSIPVDMDINERLHLVGNSPQDRAITVKNISGGLNEIEIITSDLLIDKKTAADLANALVSIAQGERVGIDPNANIVQAIIQNTVTLAANQLMGINPAANEVVATIQNLIGIDPASNVVTVDQPNKRYNALASRTINAGSASIGNKNNRLQLLLTADSNNADVVWLGNTIGEGSPLTAGEKITLDCNRALTLSGTDNDQVHVAEIISL